MATVELWKTTGHARRAGGRWAAWLAFGLGICLSLLLAVELLNRALKRHRAETGNETSTENAEPSETGHKTASVVRLALAQHESRTASEPTAEQRMWAYYVTERAKGRTPTGAELDRIAATNNYGRRVLRRWQQAGRITNERSNRSAVLVGG